jgi:hypothetical protein
MRPSLSITPQMLVQKKKKKSLLLGKSTTNPKQNPSVLSPHPFSSFQNQLASNNTDKENQKPHQQLTKKWLT